MNKSPISYTQSVGGLIEGAFYVLLVKKPGFFAIQLLNLCRGVDFGFKCAILVPKNACWPQDSGLNLRNLRLFVTTKTLEKAIAPAASIGLSNPNAAAGIKITL